MLLLLFLVILPSIGASIDCRTACVECKNNKVDQSKLEVLCAMCRECKERRRERREKVLLAEKPAPTEYGWNSQEIKDPPPGCPTAPPCPEEREELNEEETTAISQTSPAPSCPPPIPCKTKLKASTHSFPPCRHCIPICPNPCPMTTSPSVDPLSGPPETNKDFFYVYIGLPKDALNITEN